MGLLGDFTAYIDGLKRRGMNTAKDLASDPMGLLGRNVSALSESLPAAPGEPQNEMLARPGMQDWATGVAMNAPTMGLLGHTVYHGSPHKFDKFDASKIGTGEGAQAYGHGLYFSDSKDVAKAYAKNKGHTYTVDMPDEMLPKMLDWDKPLIDQPKNASDFYRMLATNGRLQPNPFRDAELIIKNQGNKNNFPVDKIGLDINKMTGEQLDLLMQNYLTGRRGMTRQSAKKWLTREMEDGGGVYSAKIPGIRFLDHDSNADKGSYNYVVFPGMEHLLKILERE